MPVAPNTPEPLKTALEDMEAKVQSTKRSLAFCAPEMENEFWGNLQTDLADTIATLYTEITGNTDIGSFGEG